MRKPKNLLALLLYSVMTFGVMSVPAHAERLSTITLEQVQQDIRSRIQYGLERGLITPNEARVFYRKERDIQFRDMRYRQNPHASPRERDELWRDVENMRMEVDRKLSGKRGKNSASPSLDQRQAQLNDNINRGIAAGLITRGEAQQLQQRQRDISRREARLRASGNLNRVERDRLHRDLDALEWETNRLLDHAYHYR